MKKKKKKEFKVYPEGYFPKNPSDVRAYADQNDRMLKNMRELAASIGARDGISAGDWLDRLRREGRGY